MSRYGKRAHAAAFPELLFADIDSLGSSPPAVHSTPPPPRYSTQEGAQMHQSPARFIPGQWEDREDEELPDAPDAPAAPAAATEATRATIFTTVCRLLPGWLKAYATPVARLVNRYARHQTIRAEPVVCDNGGRKRILLDAGEYKDAESPGRALDSFTPGLLLDSIQDAQEKAFFTTSRAQTSATHRFAGPIAASPRNKGTSPRGRKTSTTNNALNNGRSYATSWTKSAPAAKKVLPIAVRKAPAPKEEPQHAPQGRVSQLAVGHANHTTRAQNAPRRLGLAAIRPKSVADFLRAENTIKKAREESLITHKNWVEKQKARAQAIATLPTPETEDDKPAGARKTLPQEAQQETQHSDYENDLLNLPDAPEVTPPRSASFDHKARVKWFWSDSRVDEPLDSSFTDVNFSSPSKNIGAGSEEEEEVDASAMSIEYATLEMQDLSMADEEPEPSPTPEPVLPLLPELHSDKLAHILAASQASHAGRKLNASIGTGKVNIHNLKTLLPHEFNGSASAWVNDDIINEFLTLLTDRTKEMAGYVSQRNGPAPPVHAFASQWYTTASQDLTKVKRWAFRKNLGGSKMLDANLLLFPLCDTSHWRLLAVKPKDRTIEYFDSLYMPGAKYLSLARQYLKQELGDLWVEDEWKDISGRSMGQLNGSDCGVFTCLNALALLRGEEPSRVESNDGMLLARRHIAVALLTEDVKDLLPA